MSNKNNGYASEMNPIKTKAKPISDREIMIDAWRTLYYGDLLTDKEKNSISNKINKKYP